MTRTTSRRPRRLGLGTDLILPLTLITLLLSTTGNLLVPGAHARDVEVCNSYTQTLPADFLFLIDGSGSMCPYINTIEQSLQSFIQQLTQQGVDATFAVAAFGGVPTLLQPFSANGTLTQGTIGAIGCTRGGQEAGLEVIRMSLANNSGSDFNKNCVKPYNTQAACVLNWRANAKKNIIIATDEDSDLPTLSKYMVGTQSASTALCPTQYNSQGTFCSEAQFEPPFQPRVFWSPGRQYFRNTSTPLTIDSSYVTEIATTAQIVVENGARVSMLIKSDFNANRNGPISNYDSSSTWFNQNAPDKSVTSVIHTTIYQYGDPAVQSEDPNTFANFNNTATLAGLQGEGLGNSFQAQVLAKGGYVRLFRIQDIVDSGQYVINNIYQAIAQQVQNCSYQYVPDPVSCPLAL
ncbi:hypothetical protein HK101_006678 [Irineochytrium annulatum]|nr:hypothetical protein HK101_006678 [Irineochytrium annulatum]